MCDRSVRASRAVTVKELARSVSAVLREVEVDGKVVVLSRRGRMIALLSPLPERMIIDLNGETPSTAEEPDENAPEFELEPLEVELLIDAMSGYPMPFSMGSFSRKHPGGVSATAIAFSRLERKGLVENGTRGRELTAMGLAVARQRRRDSAKIDA